MFARLTTSGGVPPGAKKPNYREKVRALKPCSTKAGIVSARREQEPPSPGALPCRVVTTRGTLGFWRTRTEVEIG
jgi:hypothetical protein